RPRARREDVPTRGLHLAGGGARSSRLHGGGRLRVRALRRGGHARGALDRFDRNVARARSVAYAVLVDELEPRVFAVVPAHLRRRTAVGHHDVGREVVLAADQRRTDAVGVDRHSPLLEGPDPLGREAAGDDDLDVLEAVAVERLAYLAHELLVHAARVEVAYLVPERAVDELLGRVEANTPEPRPECPRDLQRRPDRVVLEVDEHGHVDLRVGVLDELGRREHRVAAVRPDQRVRNRADATATPPGGLRVRGDADLGADD